MRSKIIILRYGPEIIVCLVYVLWLDMPQANRSSSTTHFSRKAFLYEVLLHGHHFRTGSLECPCNCSWTQRGVIVRIVAEIMCGRRMETSQPRWKNTSSNFDWFPRFPPSRNRLNLIVSLTLQINYALGYFNHGNRTISKESRITVKDQKVQAQSVVVQPSER